MKISDILPWKKKGGKGGRNGRTDNPVQVPDIKEDPNGWKKSLGIEGDPGIGDKGVPDGSGITGFSFHRDGTIGGDTYNYNIACDGQKYVFSYEHMMLRDYGEMTAEIPESTVTALKNLYLSCKIYRWDGFSEYSRMISDGSGFSLYIDFADGKSMRASGHNSFPDGYRDFKSELDNIFAPICAELKEEGRRKLIEKGVKGGLHSVIAMFKQQGSSGDDCYEVCLFHRESRSYNFEVKIDDSELRCSYNCAMPDEALNFEKLDEIIKKHNIMQWHDWNRSAKDYSNEEWFQINFNYDEGRICAMGTEHPEGYEEFRKDFILWLKETVSTAEEKFGLGAEG